MNYQLDLHGEMLMEQYHERLSIYKRIEQLAIGALRQALDTQRVRVTALESRIKAADSLAGKLELKGAKYNSLDDVTDILGIRIVTFYGTDVDKVAAIVSEIFDVDWRNSVDKRKLHRLDSFGYNSLHYICRLPKNISDDADMPQLNELPFEIQMRTALQHVWSDLDHDTKYKGDIKIPREYLRQFNRLAGMLELIDEEFDRLRNALADYRRQMLTLQASGQLDNVYLNADTFRQFLDTRPFNSLNQRIASINQAELYPAPMMYFLLVLQELGMETLGDVNRLIEDYSDDAFKLAASQLGTTDIDILSENIGLQNLCYVYILKKGGGATELCKVIDLLNGSDPNNIEIANEILKHARELTHKSQETSDAANTKKS